MELTETTPLSRRDRERLLHRRTMLDAARAVFAEKGYDNATLDEIAQRAEYGKGTLYNYFPGGKEELLLAAISEIYAEIYEHVRSHFAPEARQGLPVREVFRAWFTEMIRYFLNQRDFFHLIVKEAHRMVLSGDAEKVAFLHQQRHKGISLIIPTIEEAIAAGEMRPLPAPGVAEMIVGNLNGYLMHVCIVTDCEPTTSKILTPEEGANFLITILFDGLSLR